MLPAGRKVVDPSLDSGGVILPSGLWTPRRMSVPRAMELLGSRDSLCDASGRFPFDGFQADGTSFPDTFFEGNSAGVANPAAVTRTPIVVNGINGGGVTGLIERVQDLECEEYGAETAAENKYAWRLTVDGTHYQVSNHPRAQISTPYVYTRGLYTSEFQFRWETATEEVGGVYLPIRSWAPHDAPTGIVLVWQVHQSLTGQSPEAGQDSNVPPLAIHWEDGGWVAVVNRVPEDLCGSQDAGGWRRFTRDEWQTSFRSTPLRIPSRKYVDLRLHYYLDERERSQGGRGFFKGYVGGRLWFEYVGPTLHPPRALNKAPQQNIPAAHRLGMYFFNTPHDASNGVVDTWLNGHANVVKPWKTARLLIKKFRVRSGGI